MLQILSLYFALRYCFTRDEKKKNLFSRNCDGGPRNVLQASRSSLVSRMNFPWGLQSQKKHFNVIFHLAV